MPGTCAFIRRAISERLKMKSISLDLPSIFSMRIAFASSLFGVTSLKCLLDFDCHISVKYIRQCLEIRRQNSSFLFFGHIRSEVLRVGSRLGGNNRQLGDIMAKRPHYGDFKLEKKWGRAPKLASISILRLTSPLWG